MTDFFSSEPMKYFSPPASMSAEVRRAKLEQMAASGLYLYGLKTDGNWSRAIVSPERSALQTRGISKTTGTYGEIQDKVLFWEAVQEAFHDMTVLLGEVYLPGGIDKDTGAILRCLGPKALARQKDNPLRWRIFDVLCYEGVELMNTAFEERIKYIPKAVKAINNPLVEGITYYEMTDSFFDEIQEIFAQGGEGAVCYRKDAIYIAGKRGPHSWESCKVKQEISNEIDCFITGLVPCERSYHGDNIADWELWENTRTGELVRGLYYGEYQNGAPYIPVSKNYFHGWPGAIEVSVYDTKGQIFPLCNVAGLTDEMKEDLKNNFEEWNRCPIKIGGMMVSTAKQGAPSIRHPYIRSIRKGDIRPEDCTLEKIMN